MANRRLAALFCSLALASCSRAGASWGTPGEARVGFLGDIWTLNPLIAFSQRLIDLTQLTTQPLVGVSPGNAAIPVLCDPVPSVANGGISRDGLTITYHLRRNVRFADGVPFTSRDVAFTYRAILDPRNPVTEAAPYARIAALETPDPYTVRIRLKAPWSGAVRELFAASDYVFGILPAHAFASTDVSKAAWNEHPFGTGPWRVVRWVRGDGVTYEPNPYAWQKPKLRRLVVKIVADQNTALTALRAHTIDFTDIDYEQVAQARADAGIAVLAVPRNASDQLELQTQAALHDVRARQAVAYAVNRAAIAQTVYRGLSPLATTEVPPLFPEHDASIPALPYDPAKARALAKAAGLNGDVRIVFNNARTEQRAVATIVQANLRAAGIDASLHGAAPSVLYAPPAQGGIYYNGTFDIAVSGWYGGLDPETSEPWVCANRAPNGPNLARWCDAQYDAAYGDQQRTLDAAARTRDFHTMQQRIHDDAVFVLLVYRTEYEAMNPALHGVAPNMLYNFGQTEDWTLQ
jgi:peptide/nickel transport system substrate-binding protein